MGSVMPRSERVESEDGPPAPPARRENGGDRADLNALYRAERGALMWYLRSQGVGEHEAEDTVQAAFVRLLLAREQIRDPRWWLRTVALNEYRRSCPSVPNSRRRTVVVPVSPAELPDGQATAASSDPAELSGQARWALDAIASRRAHGRRDDEDRRHRGGRRTGAHPVGRGRWTRLGHLVRRS